MTTATTATLNREIPAILPGISGRGSGASVKLTKLVVTSTVALAAGPGSASHAKMIIIRIREIFFNRSILIPPLFIVCLRRRNKTFALSVKKFKLKMTRLSDKNQVPENKNPSENTV